METFDADLSDLQPSQLYISSAKLAEVQRLVGAKASPLPVRRIGGRVVLTDGHTRALAAWREGRRTVQVHWDDDALDWEAYEICVEWCLEEGIRSVADLATRVVAARQYEELWLDRCRAMHRQLAEQRGG
jgi:hypothetical protein